MRRRFFAWFMVLPILLGLPLLRGPLVGAPKQLTRTTPIFSPQSKLLKLLTDYDLTPEDEKKLLQNGFLVLDQVHYKTLGNACPMQHHTVPMFVTTDVM